MSKERACANTPVLSRRTVVACMAVAPAATVSAAVEPRDDSEILALFRKHQTYRDWMNDLPLSWSDEDLEPHYQHLFSIAARMMALPSNSAADFAAKAIVEKRELLAPHEWEADAFWIEARKLTNFSNQFQ